MITLPLSEVLHVSFCGLYFAVSTNHSVQNSPWWGRGFYSQPKVYKHNPKLQINLTRLSVTGHCYTSAYLKTEDEPRHAKTNKMSVRPAKTQISLGIRPVWSESLLCAQCGQRILWSDWADTQADLSLRLAQTHFVGFVISRLRYFQKVSEKKLVPMYYCINAIILKI